MNKTNEELQAEIRRLRDICQRRKRAVLILCDSMEGALFMIEKMAQWVGNHPKHTPAIKGVMGEMRASVDRTRKSLETWDI